jgi:arginyl-tRNA synthetase
MGNSNQIESDLKNYIKHVAEKCFDTEIKEVNVEHPEIASHGDFSTNICLVLAPRLKQSPMELAKKMVYEMNENPLITKINQNDIQIFNSVEMANPGFINLFFNPDWLLNVLEEITLSEDNYGSSDLWQGVKTIIEYTDPNPFKIFHAGHLMTNAIGESLARIIEFCGAEVKRANYQGDVGIHVANSIWGLINKMAKDNITLVDLQKKPLEARVEYLGKAYSLGATSYENDENAKAEISSLNNYLYIVAQRILVESEDWSSVVDYEVLTKGTKPPFNLDLITSLYRAGKKWSLDYFEEIYKKLGTDFDYYYFESKAGEVGFKKVMDHVDDRVFKKDQGAIIFEGEKHGLHTRVFVNSKGLPVYEAKDLGLATIKNDDYKYDKSLIITANDVDDYFRVVLKAMEFVDEDLGNKTTHIGHGMLVFKHGKMSSRTGDIISADELLENIGKKVKQKMEEDLPEETAEIVSVSSIKYSILKNGIGNDVVYDEEEATEQCLA